MTSRYEILPATLDAFVCGKLRNSQGSRNCHCMTKYDQQQGTPEPKGPDGISEAKEQDSSEDG